MKRDFRVRRGVLCLALAVTPMFAVSAQAPELPPLCIEINAEHPLFLFQVHGVRGSAPNVYAEHIGAVFGALPESLKPYSILQIDADPDDALARHEYYVALLPLLQEAQIPVAIRVADGNPARRHPPAQLAELLDAFTTVKGVEATGLSFNVYDPAFSGMLPTVQWLVDTIDTAARYGRFVHIPLDELHWTRVMSNVSCAPLYAKLTACRNYVIPSALHRGPHTVAHISSLMGLWLEGAVAQWGIAADIRWYTDAGFVKPGVFGIPAGAEDAPSALYRAMILNGAMTGATVYAFSPDTALWFGPENRHWNAAIYPTLVELLDAGLIARQDFVHKQTPVAYQLAPSITPLDFHANLRDIDDILDEGLLLHAAYGPACPGRMPELILNRGDRFWVPILSTHASEEIRGTFKAVAQPGARASTEEWATLLDAHATPVPGNAAFVASVGRGIFVMNTQENLVEPQAFTIPEAPAPVRGISVRREGETVVLTWPFREGDVSYSVYRRVLPESHFSRLATGLQERRWVDGNPVPDQSLAYAVTALTSEKEPLSGTVDYGEYLTFSVVESRIADEAVLSPVLTVAESTAIALATESASPPPTPRDWRENYEGLEEGQLPLAQAITDRINLWETAFQNEDLDGVLDIYLTEYKDPQGWGFLYVRRAYQWFFERYTAPRMHRQIRRWNFSSYANNSEVHVLMYVRLTGTAVSDTAGRIADIPVSIPLTETAEIWISFTDKEGIWRIQHTNPALPNFRDLLSYSAGPYDHFPTGPDEL